MSLNDSFIKEVSEEVRRDKLYKYFKKYIWIAVVFLLILIGLVAYNEWDKSTTKKNNQLNGDELLQALNVFSKGENLNDYFSYIDKNKSGSELAILNPSFLDSQIEIDKKLKYLKNLKNNENISIELRDLASLYLFYKGNYNYDEKFEILNQLSGPDRPFRFIAIEAKIDLFLEKKLIEEALQEIKILQPELPNSSQIKGRITNLEMILQTLNK